MKYYHRMYNLTIESDFFIPEAEQIEKKENVDIHILIENPPVWVEEMIKEGKIDYLEKDVMWFRLPLKSNLLYYIEHGNKIIIHYNDINELKKLDITSYLTGTVMTLLMIQRDILPLHGSAISIHDKSIVVLGRSGAGKSTTLGELLNYGQFIADDVSALQIMNNEAYVLPAFPQQKLCRDAALRCNEDLDKLIYIDEDRDKFAKRLTHNYISEPTHLSCIFEIILAKGTGINMSEILGTEKLKVLMMNTYRGFVFERIGVPKCIMENMIKIVKDTPIYRIERGMESNSIKEIVKYILEKNNY